MSGWGLVAATVVVLSNLAGIAVDFFYLCLLYTSDAADERSSVDLGGRRIIKKKKSRDNVYAYIW